MAVENASEQASHNIWVSQRAYDGASYNLSFTPHCSLVDGIENPRSAIELRQVSHSRCFLSRTGNRSVQCSRVNSVDICPAFPEHDDYSRNVRVRTMLLETWSCAIFGVVWVPTEVTTFLKIPEFSVGVLGEQVFLPAKVVLGIPNIDNTHLGPRSYCPLQSEVCSFWNSALGKQVLCERPLRETCTYTPSPNVYLVVYSTDRFIIR